MRLYPRVTGQLDFNGSVDVTDPCYSRNVWCRLNEIKVAAGKYLCTYWTQKRRSKDENGKTYTYEIVRAARIQNVEFPFRVGTDKWEEIGDIGVDSGLAGFFHNKPDYNDEEWSAFCAKWTRNGKWQKAVCDADGFTTNTGDGDGCYPVYAVKNDQGQIVALEIRY